MNRRTDARVWVQGVVREVVRPLGARPAGMVVCTGEGRVVRGRLPAGLRDGAVALVGRRVRFQAYVDGQGRYYYPIHAEVVQGFMRLEVTGVSASRLARWHTVPMVVVDLRTEEAGDAVLLIPVSLVADLQVALTHPVTLPSADVPGEDRGQPAPDCHESVGERVG